MDAKMERPETREFKDNRPLETACANRVKLVIAGLTVLRAWHVARPTANIKLSPLDFVEWTERVRKALVWLGRADPGDTMEKARETIPTASNALPCSWNAIGSWVTNRFWYVRSLPRQSAIQTSTRHEWPSQLLVMGKKSVLTVSDGG
jgi:hypothetical protein